MHRQTIRLLVVASLLLALFVVSCNFNQNHRTHPRANSADSILFDIGTQKQYARMIELADSFEMEGALSQLDANRWRGVAY